MAGGHAVAAPTGRSVHHANGLPPEPPKSKWDRWNLTPSPWVGVPIQFIEILILVTPSSFMPTILLDFFDQSYPLSAISTGVADSLGGLLAFFASPTIGRWSDTHGRKKVIMGISLLNFLPIACLLFYPYLNLWCYLSVRCFNKVSAFGLLLSTISDVASEESRAKYYGMTTGIAFSGVVLGPLISLFLDAAPTFKVTGGFAVLVILYLFFLMPETLWVGLKRMEVKEQERADAAAAAAAVLPASLSESSISITNNEPDSLKLGRLQNGTVYDSTTTDHDLNSALLSHQFPDSSSEQQQLHHPTISVNSIEPTNEVVINSTSFSVGPPGILQSDVNVSAVGSTPLTAPPSMNPFTAIRLAFKSKLHRNLALIILFSQISQNGIIECAMLYLKYHLDFTKDDNSKLLIAMGIWSCIVMVAIMPILLKKRDEKFVLLLATIMDFCHQMMYIFLPNKKYFWFISFCQGFGFMSYPASNALLANSVTDAEQGSILAMSAGIRSLTQGIAPILFNGLFSYFTWDRAFAHFPEAPFLLSSTCIFITIILTTQIPKSKAQIEREAIAAASAAAAQTTRVGRDTGEGFAEAFLILAEA